MGLGTVVPRKPGSPALLLQPPPPRTERTLCPGSPDPGNAEGLPAQAAWRRAAGCLRSLRWPLAPQSVPRPQDTPAAPRPWCLRLLNQPS